MSPLFTNTLKRIKQFKLGVNCWHERAHNHKWMNKFNILMWEVVRILRFSICRLFTRPLSRAAYECLSCVQISNTYEAHTNETHNTRICLLQLHIIAYATTWQTHICIQCTWIAYNLVAVQRKLVRHKWNKCITFDCCMHVYQLVIVTTA